MAVFGGNERVLFFSFASGRESVKEKEEERESVWRRGGRREVGSERLIAALSLLSGGL